MTNAPWSVNHEQRARDLRLRYSSRVCFHCKRDFLYPDYGGWAICNDCKFTEEDDLATRNQLREFLQAAALPPGTGLPRMRRAARGSTSLRIAAPNGGPRNYR